jgi:hypothetical protein
VLKRSKSLGSTNLALAFLSSTNVQPERAVASVLICHHDAPY